MRKRSFVTFALLVTAVALESVSAQRISDYRDPDVTYDEGWTDLFNGQDLQGWVVVMRMEDGSSKKFMPADQSLFTVGDGKIRTTGNPNGCLRTLGVYDNYVFHVEILYPEGSGNTGVLIHCQNDEVWPQAVECQGYNDHMGRIFPIRGATLEGGEMIHAAASPLGQWNTYEVYSEEGRIATVVNGKVVGLASNSDPKVGYICLQSEGVPVEFRNIKIKNFVPAHHMRPKPRP